MSKGKPVVMLVDDEERILRSLTIAFRSQYRVLATTSAHEALTWLANEQVDVIMSDQRMPIMSGVDLLREAKQVSPDTVRLLLTGYSELANIVGSINEGEIFRYLQKPWSLAELKATLAEAVEVAQTTHNAVVESAQDAAVLEEHEKRVNVVVLDQDDQMATLLQTMRPDWAIRLARTLDQALTSVEAYHAPILITELILPEGNITHGLQLLKKNRPELVVLVVTAFSDTQNLVKLINRTQVYRVLPRPVATELLERHVQSAFRHHKMLMTKPALQKRYRVEAKSDPYTESEQRLVERVRGYLRRLGVPS